MKTAPAAEPLVFGEGHDLIGWYHAPKASDARDLGVVICAPHGYDSLCVHWALRLLAERLASTGVPTVRFDYHGTGDSLGDDRMPGRVPAWLGSIDAAIELLKARSFVTRVALIGLRLGASLATAAACARTDVDALVMYGPCLSGRTYVREQKALGLTRHPGDPVDEVSNSGDVLMAGWLISEETSTALGKLDVAKVTRPPAKAVLILHREDFPIDERPQKHLTALGVTVTAAKTEGWVAFMQDALTSRLPERDFDTIVAWLLERSTTNPSLTGSPLSQPRQLQAPTFFEEPVQFSSRALFGVLCVPKDPAPEKPLVVFLNTAANHHIGPHRSTVDLARALASRGIASLRFDVGGLGDSPAGAARPQNAVYSMPATQDVVAAIDFLQGRGFLRVALTGLCSGGFLAFHTAATDERVQALVLVNLQRFLWRPGDSLDVARRLAVPSTTTYLHRALRLDTWTRLAKGSVDVRLIGTALATRGLKLARGRASEVASRWLGPTFEPSQIPRGFRKMLARGVSILMVYGESDGGLDELAANLGPNMRKLQGSPDAELVLLSNSDHTLTTTAARDTLLSHLTRVMLRRR